MRIVWASGNSTILLYDMPFMIISTELWIHVKLLDCQQAPVLILHYHFLRISTITKTEFQYYTTPKSLYIEHIHLLYYKDDS